MLVNLLSAANSQRFSHQVISLGSQSRLETRLEKLNIPVFNLNMKPGRIPTPAQVWRLLAIVRRCEPHVIQGWMYHGSIAAQLSRVCVARRARVLWGIHSCNSDLSLEKRLTAAVIRTCKMLSSRPNQIIYVSLESRRQHERMGFKADKACVISNGFDIMRFAPSAQVKMEVRGELGLQADQLLIGHVGRFHPMKDHVTFLGAACKLLKSHPGAKFLLIGRGVNAENQALRDLLTRYELNGSIHLLGERSDTSRLICTLDICSLSSSYGESFPLVIGEAMACGVPCVVTDVGDSARLVGNTGLVVPPGKPEALALAWTTLINLGATGRAQLGTAARERITGNFVLESVVAQYEKLFDNRTKKSEFSGEMDYDISIETGTL